MYIWSGVRVRTDLAKLFLHAFRTKCKVVHVSNKLASFTALLGYGLDA